MPETSTKNIVINQQRLSTEIEELASISEADPPVVTRVVFSPSDLKARAWLKKHCEDWGLSIRQDAIGNTFVRWVGSEPKAPAVGTGSHIDAIPNAGKYDGVVGVLGGLEAIRALHEAGFRPRHSIELLVFTSEEPTRFGIGCLGSRMLSGTLSPDNARKLKDKNEQSLDEVRASAGINGELASVQLPQNYYKGFVELHIEQGPILEREEIPLGIVTHIAAPASLVVTLEGSGGHAGGVLMPDRRDALCAASELILSIEKAAKSTGAIDTVATVGICDVFPGAVNSIASRVRITADVRDTDVTRRDSVLHSIEAFCREISAKRGVTTKTKVVNADAPAACAPQLIEALEGSCRAHSFSFKKMVSRAYHDSLFISRVAPTVMLFIPCHNGYSHRPDEYASPDDIARGALVLAETLARLAS